MTPDISDNPGGPDDAVREKDGEEAALSRPAWFYAWSVLRRSRPFAWSMSIFAGVTLASSFVQMVGLIALALGFAISESAGVAPPLSEPLIHVFEAREWSTLAQVMLLFSAFLTLMLIAAALMHVSWIIRLKMLSEFEGELTYRALRLMQMADPRERAVMPRRPTLLALRSDCKSVRVMLQMMLLIAVSLLTIVFPLWYMFQLHAAMSIVGLGITLIGFMPVLLLARRASAMSLPRQDVQRAAGAEVAGLLRELQAGEIRDEDAEQKIQDVREALSQQHRFWRRQYETRSLALQTPIAFSLLAAFVILLWGVVLVNDGAMTWGQLLTFIVAARVVFAPFAQIGNRWIKSAEHIPRAARHMDFMNQFSFPLNTGEPRESLPLVNGIARVDRIEFQGRLSVTGGKATPESELVAAPGDVVAIIDPEMTLDHPIRRELLGDRLVEQGRILYDGRDINRIDHHSLKCARYSKPVCKEEGPFAECVQAMVPGASRDEIERFAATVLKDQWEDWLPSGVDSIISREGKAVHPWEKNAYFLAEIYALLHNGQSIILVDQFLFGDSMRRSAMIEGVRAARPGRLIFWFDTAPRRELGPHRVAVFQDGRFCELTDADSFAHRHPDWDYHRINRPAKPEKVDGNAVVGAFDEEDDDDMLNEEGL